MTSSPALSAPAFMAVTKEVIGDLPEGTDVIVAPSDDGQLTVIDAQTGVPPHQHAVHPRSFKAEARQLIIAA